MNFLSLHVLLVQHGKTCVNCAKGGKLQHKNQAVEKCPFIGWNSSSNSSSSSSSSKMSGSSSSKNE